MSAGGTPLPSAGGSGSVKVQLPTPSEPKPISQPEKSEAAHMGLVNPQASSVTSEGSTLSNVSGEYCGLHREVPCGHWCTRMCRSGTS